MALQSASGEKHSAYSTASPHTSGMAEIGIAITGVPIAIASSGGNPNPSYSDAKTSATERL